MDWSCQGSPKQDNREWPNTVERFTRSPIGCGDHAEQLVVKLRRE